MTGPRIMQHPVRVHLTGDGARHVASVSLPVIPGVLLTGDRSASDPTLPTIRSHPLRPPVRHPVGVARGAAAQSAGQRRADMLRAVLAEMLAERDGDGV